MNNQSMAHPLHWPAGHPRRRAYERQRNTKWRNVSVATACAAIDDEVRRLRGSGLVISTNLALRIDGWPRSGQSAPADPGVAVYFTRKGTQLVFACDKYATVEQNLRAVAKHLDALRGQERWGVGTLDQAFAGYAALPDTPPWWKVLGADRPHDSYSDLMDAYRRAAKVAHPDAGGSDSAFVTVRRAYDEGLEHLNRTVGARP